MLNTEGSFGVFYLGGMLGRVKVYKYSFLHEKNFFYGVVVKIISVSKKKKIYSTQLRVFKCILNSLDLKKIIHK